MEEQDEQHTGYSSCSIDLCPRRRAYRQYSWLDIRKPSIWTFVHDLCVGHVLPGLAVAVRRLHDIDESGWMILVAFVPTIGGIWLLVLLAMDSQAGTNAYGPTQKKFKQPSGFTSTQKSPIMRLDHVK